MEISTGQHKKRRLAESMQNVDEKLEVKYLLRGNRQQAATACNVTLTN